MILTSALILNNTFNARVIKPITDYPQGNKYRLHFRREAVNNNPCV